MNKPVKPYDNITLVFGESNITNLNFDHDVTYIVESVFQKGDVEDIRMCRRFYGDQAISDVLIKASWPTARNIAFFVALFENEPEDYSAYQSNK